MQMPKADLALIARKSEILARLAAVLPQDSIISDTGELRL